MAKKTKDKKTDKPKKKSKILILASLIIIILIIASCGLLYYNFVYKHRFIPIDNSFFKIPEQTERYLHYNHKNLYSLIRDVNKELMIIDNEIERIKQLEKKYPEQNDITEDAVSKLEETKNNSTEKINEVINRLNTVYIHYQLNSENKDELINKNTEELLTKTEKILEELKKVTQRFKKDENNKNFIDKLKSIID
ncbi:MAG: hypothetical protein ACQEQS_02105 [Thermodesulfobacteriota bacterium]